MSGAAALLILAAAGATPATALECPAIPGLTLAYFAIYEGPPKKQADLAPDRTTKQAGITTNLWQLYQGPDGLSVKCGYGKSLAGPYNRVETITLPASAKTCRADFTSGPGAGDLTLQKFSCQ